VTAGYPLLLELQMIFSFNSSPECKVGGGAHTAANVRVLTRVGQVSVAGVDAGCLAQIWLRLATAYFRVLGNCPQLPGQQRHNVPRMSDVLCVCAVHCDLLQVFLLSTKAGSVGIKLVTA
jgi:hypothetical protein